MSAAWPAEPGRRCACDGVVQFRFAADLICLVGLPGRPRAAAEDIDQIFSEIDVDASGEISMQELTAWHFNKSVMIKSDRQKI